MVLSFFYNKEKVNYKPLNNKIALLLTILFLSLDGCHPFNLGDPYFLSDHFDGNLLAIVFIIGYQFCQCEYQFFPHKRACF